MMSKEWDGEVLIQLSAKWAERVVFYEECESTNDEAAELAKRGAISGSVILAERQTRGRGRRGRDWHCAAGEGIAMSYLYQPEYGKEKWSRIALAAGLAMAEGLEILGLQAQVKWPNDVWVGGKKICGILVERKDDFVIIGAGLNVNVSEFPDDLAEVATSFLLEKDEEVSREEVLVTILERLEKRIAQVGEDFEEILQSLSQRCALRGKEVSLVEGEAQRHGKVVGFGDGGELLLESEGEVRKILQAEVVRVS